MNYPRRINSYASGVSRLSVSTWGPQPPTAQSLYFPSGIPNCTFATSTSPAHRRCRAQRLIMYWRESLSLFGTGVTVSEKSAQSRIDSDSMVPKSIPRGCSVHTRNSQLFQTLSVFRMYNAVEKLSAFGTIDYWQLSGREGVTTGRSERTSVRHSRMCT